MLPAVRKRNVLTLRLARRLREVNSCAADPGELPKAHTASMANVRPSCGHASNRQMIAMTPCGPVLRKRIIRIMSQASSRNGN